MYLIILLLPLVLFFYRFSRDVFNPAFLLSSSFIFVSLIIIWTSDILVYEFELETQLFIFANVVIFSFSSLSGALCLKGTSNQNYRLESRISYNTLVIVFVTVASAYVILRFNGYGTSLSEIRQSLHEIRSEEVSEGHSQIQYLLTVIYVLWGWLLIARENTSKNKLLLILMLILLLAVSIASTSKQATFMLFISTFFIMTKRRLKSILLFALLGVCVFLFFSFVVRNNDSSNFILALKTYLTMYISSPTIAMQENYLLWDKLGDSNLLRFFAKLSGEEVPSSLHRPFVYVGVPTNVYTAYSDYVVYGWFVSIIVSSIHGFICGVLWKLSYFSLWAKIFYSLFAYSIVFAFFHESFMTYLSLWLQILILALVVSLSTRLIFWKKNIQGCERLQ
ncbi:oligosaccharide repeat unit polymerase [Enterobacter sp. K16B]|uniref:O-antigen polymerase n=1 Tax=Enterobacter sp. K16B TaxID=2878537 RepID=UPI001CD9894C|nr:O-antigen polymerase [Enterobacter sp. K16B]MCA2025347.1 oligosaccharide repeat unit polymerase [Enterobacter sp. K16B]